MGEKTQQTYKLTVVYSVAVVEEYNATAHYIRTYGLELFYIGEDGDRYVAVFPQYEKFFFNETMHSGIPSDAVLHYE